MKQETINAIKEVQKERMELTLKKNHDYSGVVDNILLAGEYGIAVRIFDKACRLLSLVTHAKREVMNETIEDTLKDLANYGDYGVLLVRDKWEG